MTNFLKFNNIILDITLTLFFICELIKEINIMVK